MRIRYKIGLLAALLTCIWKAYGEDNYLKGYDADHKNYFHRVHIPDNSVQLGFSAGCTWYKAELVRPEDFRNGLAIEPAANYLYAGLSGEKTFFKARLSVATGIYYSQLNAYLFGWPNHKGGAYIIDYEDDFLVSYTLVSDVKSISSYVSIPLEVSCSLVNGSDFGIYLKGNATANVSVHSATELIAKNSAPEDVKQRLAAYFRGSEAFFISAHAKAGMRWGSYDIPNFRLEVGIPLTLSKGSAAYYRVSSGITAQVALYIPLYILYL
jgi:hypothetical protein